MKQVLTALTFVVLLLGSAVAQQVPAPPDVAALKPSTALMTSICGEIFGETETALNWLLQQGTAVREKPAGQGQVFVDFPHEKWKSNYEAAIDGLHLLETYGEVAAKVLAG